MNLSTIPLKWLLCGVVVITLITGFIAGRLTGGADALLPFTSDGSQSSSGGGSGLKGIFGGADNSSGGGEASGGLGALGQPKGGYTKESLIEVAKSINLYSGMGPKKLREMLAIQDSLGKQDVKALVYELAADRTLDSQQALYVAMGVFAEQSPTEALDFVIDQLGNKQQVRFGIYQAVTVSMEQDPNGTLAKVEAIEDANMRKQAMTAVINTMAAKDPQKAFQFYLSAGDTGGRSNSIYMIYHHWGRKDPLAAAQSLSQITDSQKRSQAMSSLVGNWVGNDPEAAWQWAKQQPPASQGYQDPRYHALTAWARKDPLAALAAAESLESPALRRQALPGVVQNWAQTDPEAALDWISQHPDPSLMEDAFRNIGHSNTIPPERLFNIAMEKMPAGNAFRNTVSQVLSSWAQKDPAAAAAAVQSLPPGDAFNSSAGNVAREWSKNDPQAAFSWVTSLPEGSGRSNTLNNIFSEITRSNPEQVQGLYNRLTSKEQDKVAYNIASSMASTDPNAALQFSASLSNESVKKRTQDSIARSWARQDPEQASAWAAGLPKDQRGGAVSNVISSWADKNVEAAAEWLASMPADASLDEASKNLSRKLVGVDPEAAMSWAESIVDDSQRQRAVYDSARQWIRNDPTNGRAWVQRSNLSDKDKQKLLK